MGRRPSLAMKKSPLFFSLMTPVGMKGRRRMRRQGRPEDSLKAPPTLLPRVRPEGPHDPQVRDLEIPAAQPQLLHEGSQGDQATGPEGSVRLGGAPSHCFLLVPCFREIFQAGPSRDRSTSIWLSLVALPRVIWGNGAGEGWDLRNGSTQAREREVRDQTQEGRRGRDRQRRASCRSTRAGPAYLSRAHQVPHHAAPQHGQRLVVEVRRAHAWGRSRARVRQGPALAEGREPGARERRGRPATHAQGPRVGRRERERGLPVLASPVMLSTSTCHLCSSCSSCRISRFWRRSATVSSGGEGR